MKRAADDTEETWEGDMPAKCQNTGKCDPQAARLKASREKQRRLQLNSRCASLPGGAATHQLMQHCNS